MTCIYCGCTVDNARVVELDEQPQPIRDRIRRVYRAQRREPPAQMGCSWISTKPPVCSAQPCRQAHAEARR